MGRPARIDCRTASRWLSAALEVTLPDEQRRALQAHLKHCRACATLRDQLQVLRIAALPGAARNALRRPH